MPKDTQDMNPENLSDNLTAPNDGQTENQPVRTEEDTGVRKRDPEDAAESTSAPDSPDDASNEVSRQYRSAIARMRNESEEVLTVSGEKISSSRFDDFSKSLIDLTASKRNKKILTDRMTGIETVGSRVNAILLHGEFKILIPDLYMFDPKDRGYEVPKEVAFQHVITGRLNSEIDYIVEEIDIENRIAIGNHLDASRRKQKAFFFDVRSDGRPLVKERMIVEARVISVRRFGIFIDVFGCESFIPNLELSYTRLPDARERFSNGDVIQVRISKIEPISDDHVRVTASAKDAYPDPRIDAMRLYHVDGLYNGKVTVIDDFGVFVILGNGAECKCEYPKERFPTVGATVSVRIYNVDLQEKLLWGVITRIISA